MQAFARFGVTEGEDSEDETRIDAHSVGGDTDEEGGDDEAVEEPPASSLSATQPVQGQGRHARQKERHKAARANHNRKAAAARKRGGHFS